MSSKSQFYKNIKKEKEKLRALFSNENIPNENALETASGSSLEESVDLNNININTPDLKSKLKAWVQQFNPSVKACRSLFQILREENLDVPLSVKTLLGPIQECTIRTVAPGQYVHIGLLVQLKKIEHLFDSSITEIYIDIGVDGLPLFKSSGTGVWPILCKIVGKDNIDAFLIGTYIGPNKPSNVDTYLYDFLNEYKELHEDGFNLNGRIVKCTIRAFICDTPARAFMCGVKGHTSFNGCTKCHQSGWRINNVNTYSTEKHMPRTDESFSERSDKNFHQSYFLYCRSRMEELGIKMISQFPIEPMHMVDLGVTKKILNKIYYKKVVSLTNDQKLEMSATLLSLAPYVPKEFARKPRAFDEMCRWKATEYRQFILYTGIVVLKKFIPTNFYNHFLTLHVSYRCLLRLDNSQANLIEIDKLMREFVYKFPEYFGISSVSYNVHGLLHLVECVEEYGDLNSVSAYKFENFMKNIKRKIKMPKHIGKQIFNKFIEEPIVVRKSTTGPKFNAAGDVIAYQSETCYFTHKAPNNYCLIKPNIFLSIIRFYSDGTFIAKPFLDPQNFFDVPINSLKIGICVVNPNNFGPEKKYNVNNISSKLMSLPFEGKLVLIPILHSLQTNYYLS